jgi:hypothetical protein
MKKLILAAGVLVLLLSAHRTNAEPIGVSFGVFYSSLGPHGEWITCNDGVYAWRPVGVSSGWRPYFDGRWCWTDEGWYWASDEPWAWATYHYGRWYFDDFYGWVWVPGYDWAPAWVEWRYGGGAIGWAPLSPYAIFTVGFGIHYRSYWMTPHSWWSFVDCRYIGDRDIHRYVYRSENNTRYIGRTRSAGSVRYDGGRIVSRGPEKGYIERYGNVRLERAEIRDVEDRQIDRVVRDGGRERVEVYRPHIEGRDDNGRQVRPDRIRSADRNITFDTRGMDLRSRDVDRENGRDLRRAEEFRGQPDTRISREGGRPTETPGHTDRQAGVGRTRDREVERRAGPPAVDRGRQRDAQPEARPERRVERRREDVRAPEREVRSRQPDHPRTERPPAQHPDRGGERRNEPGGRGGRR